MLAFGKHLQSLLFDLGEVVLDGNTIAESRWGALLTHPCPDCFSQPLHLTLKQQGWIIDIQRLERFASVIAPGVATFGKFTRDALTVWLAWHGAIAAKESTHV